MNYIFCLFFCERASPPPFPQIQRRFVQREGGGGGGASRGPPYKKKKKHNPIYMYSFFY